MMALATASCSQQHLRMHSTLPSALTSVQLVYVSSGLQPDYSRMPRGFSIYGDNNAALQTRHAEDAAIKLKSKGVGSVDTRIAQLAPGILQQNGLRGTVSTYVTSHRMRDDMNARAEEARAGTPQMPVYWLIIWPGAGVVGAFGSSLTFEATLWNLTDRRDYWKTAYTMELGRGEIDDEKVGQMLSALIGTLVTDTRL